MKDWIPKEIIEWDEFLSESLKEVRDYILANRNENFYIISLDLYTYEERVLFYFDVDECKKIGWKYIVNFEDENGITRKEDERKVKRHFLRGWLEDRIWDKKLKKQHEYKIPDNLDTISLAPEDKGYFFRDESVEFAKNSFQKFRDKYRFANCNTRGKNPRFIDNTNNRGISGTWYVYVAEELRYFYYDRTTHKTYCSEIAVDNEKFHSISCARKTETPQAVIANYISWQDMLWTAERTEKGDKMKRNNCFEEMRQLVGSAEKDTFLIPSDIRVLINIISNEKRISELTGNEQDKIIQTAKISPKVRLAVRKAQLNYIRKKIRETNASTSPNLDITEKICEWVSPIWTLLPATAALSSDSRKKEFEIEKLGTIEIAIKVEAAYMIVSWHRKTLAAGALFINFQAEKDNSYFSLGSKTSGKKMFSHKELNLDPTRSQLDVSIKFELAKGEK
ncbi:MAG: hypothetical protein GY749_44630 [Desulfobacteraceae bacterium]|nr:hypothetical protein [Desulfobacteraceae bacterium]